MNRISVIEIRPDGIVRVESRDADETIDGERPIRRPPADQATNVLAAVSPGMDAAEARYLWELALRVRVSIRSKGCDIHLVQVGREIADLVERVQRNVEKSKSQKVES